MHFTSLNPNENRINGSRRVSLSHRTILRFDDNKSEIKLGMSPKEISEIVSDHLMNEVTKQFEKTKKELLESAK